MTDTLRSTPIPGCFRLVPDCHIDARGYFCKTFNETAFRNVGLATHFRESYWSRSARRVLRGLHFQLPPHDCDKLVVCMEGQVLDVVVDLRTDSPTFGETFAVDLHGDRSEGIYVPRGLAHGFYVRSETAVMSYAVTAEYRPSHDAGIHCHSIAFAWPDSAPVLSDRDAGLPALVEFKSPFRLAASAAATEVR